MKKRWAGVKASPRLRAANLLWQASHPLALAVVGFVIAEGFLPNLALVAIGRATGLIPAAVATGMASPAGHRLLVVLGLAGFFYALSLLRGPLEDLLSGQCRLRDPTAGRITVDGVELSQLDAQQWQRHVAVVYQDFTRYPFSARENVALASVGAVADGDLLDSVAERASMNPLLERLPHGWDTLLSRQYRGGSDLSGGQWQRVALARALYAVGKGAGVLVLDEPTSQLDVRAEAAFYRRFLELTAGVTSVIISHRFATVRRADRIAVLDGGRISEQGSHSELVALGGTYAQMFSAQAGAFATGGTRSGEGSDDDA